MGMSDPIHLRDPWHSATLSLCTYYTMHCAKFDLTYALCTSYTLHYALNLNWPALAVSLQGTPICTMHIFHCTKFSKLNFALFYCSVQMVPNRGSVQLEIGSCNFWHREDERVHLSKPTGMIRMLHVSERVSEWKSERVKEWETDNWEDERRVDLLQTNLDEKDYHVREWESERVKEWERERVKEWKGQRVRDQEDERVHLSKTTWMIRIIMWACRWCSGGGGRWRCWWWWWRCLWPGQCCR